MTLRYDHDRLARTGMPEAVFCLQKDETQLADIVAELAATTAPILLTRLSVAQLKGLPPTLSEQLDHDRLSQTAFLHGRLPSRAGTVAVLTAGSSDLPVSSEARRTLEFSGITVKEYIDVGVAGLWRLEENLPAIRLADVVIVVAGMDGALASVVGGLVSAPVIAVPTSVGYGVASDGRPALNSMLTSCAQGVLVTNIDNGFGAACAAVRILGGRGPGP